MAMGLGALIMIGGVASDGDINDINVMCANAPKPSKCTSTPANLLFASEIIAMVAIIVLGYVCPYRFVGSKTRELTFLCGLLHLMLLVKACRDMCIFRPRRRNDKPTILELEERVHRPEEQIKECRNLKHLKQHV